MASTGAVTQCAACGADVVGNDKFCRSCGAAVGAASVPPAAAESPPAVAPPATRPPRAADAGHTSSNGRPQAVERRRPPLVAGVIVVVLLVVIGGAFALTRGGDDSSQPEEKSRATAEPEAAGATPAPQSAIEPPGDTEATTTPTRSDVNVLLSTYTERFDAEDADGLGELFADDGVRRSDGETQNRTQTIATYRDQFSAVNNPTYSLSGLQIDTEPGAATATGRYRIVSDSGATTGDIEFRLVQRDGHLVIARLDVRSD